MVRLFLCRQRLVASLGLDDLSAELMSLAIELGPGLASYADTMTLDLGPQ